MKPKPAAKTTNVAQTTVRRLKVKQPPTEAFQQRLAEELELKQQRKKWRAANQKRSAAKKSKIEEAVRRGEVPKAVKPQAIFFGEQRKLKPQPTVEEVWASWRALSPEKRKVYQVKAKKSVEDRKKSLQDIGILKKTQDQGPLDPVEAVLGAKTPELARGDPDCLGEEAWQRQQNRKEATMQKFCGFVLKLQSFYGELNARTELGHGTYGVVFRGFEPSTGEVVACKLFCNEGEGKRENKFYEIMHEAVATQPGDLHGERFFLENFGAYTLSDTFFAITLEYFPTDVYKVMRGGTITEHQADTILLQMSIALRYLHHCKIVHLDVKPANILFNDILERAALCDFSLSIHVGDIDESVSTVPESISNLCTERYRPPELIVPDSYCYWYWYSRIQRAGDRRLKLLMKMLDPDFSLRVGFAHEVGDLNIVLD